MREQEEAEAREYEWVDQTWRTEPGGATTVTGLRATSTESSPASVRREMEMEHESSRVPFTPSLPASAMKHYATGATRSHEKTFDPEGFLSPVVLAGYCQYMQKHRVQGDGGLRASDNWQKGMATSRAARSLQRHNLDAWLILRGYTPTSEDCTSLEDALHGVMFNCMVILKNRIDGDDHEE